MARILGRTRGQVTVEVAVLFGFVVAGIVGLAVYLQRGVQGGMKSNADSIGQQFSSANNWETHSRSNSQETRNDTKSSQTSDACQGINKANPGCNPGNVFPPLP